LRRGAIGSNHGSLGTTLKLLFNKQRRVHTTGYRGTQSQPQNPTQTTINIIKEHLMPDEEEGIQTLILTRSLHRRFIEEQKEIIRKLIRYFFPEREVFYTFFDTPKIFHEDALEDILVFKEVIYEIIFDQRGTDFSFIFGTFPKELLHVFEGSKMIYRKARLNTTRTAMRFILTRNLTNPLTEGATEELLLLQAN